MRARLSASGLLDTASPSEILAGAPTAANFFRRHYDPTRVSFNRFHNLLDTFAINEADEGVVPVALAIGRQKVGEILLDESLKDWFGTRF
ncbi:MAG: hypothetical protein ABI164_03795 [Acidobacteriaceae bacterium]